MQCQVKSMHVERERNIKYMQEKYQHNLIFDQVKHARCFRKISIGK